MAKNALLEIGTEEMPASYVAPAKEQLISMAKSYLENSLIGYEKIYANATPRRIALVIEKLDEKSKDKCEEFFGPPVSVKRDSPAAKGFAGKHGVGADDLKEKAKDKGIYFCVETKTPGRKAENILKEMFPAIISKVSFPKSMIWESSKFRFARPIRTLACLYGTKQIKFSIADVKSSNVTCGIHTLTSKRVLIPSPEKYFSTLRNNLVIVDEGDRKETIKKAVESVAKKAKENVLLDEGLLEEINYLVEHPVAVLGDFDEKYLKLPDVVLINCMKKKQKFFAVLDAKDKLTNHFIGIRNGVSENQQVVKEGYERVLTARLSDAEFFFNNDTREPLIKKYEKLKGVVFQQKLGTVHDKMERVKILAGYVNEVLKKSGGLFLDSEDINKTCELAKSDLVSEMVFEYPELQGVIGSIYAKLNGEKEDVSKAVEEHYCPITVDAKLPETQMGVVVSLADKMDTLCGYFAVGLVPSGSQDPYGLRRISVGILRMLREKNISITLGDFVEKSFTLLPHPLRENAQAKTQVSDFLKQRLENMLVNEGFGVDEVRAVLACGFDDLKDAGLRLAALAKIRKMPDFEPLAASFKRTANILKQARKNNIAIPDSVRQDLLKEEGESALFSSVSRMESDLKLLLDKKDYFEMMKKMVEIKPSVDAFFDKVMVMAEDTELRANRLAVLNYTTRLFFNLLDFSQLQN